MYSPDQLVPEVASLLGVRLGMTEADVRARFAELYFQSETAEPGGVSAAWATKLPDGPGELTMRIQNGVVVNVYWIVPLDEKQVSELSKALRARLKGLYGKPVGQDKVFRGSDPSRHHAWTTKWGFDPTNFKLDFSPGDGRE